MNDHKFRVGDYIRVLVFNDCEDDESVHLLDIKVLKVKELLDNLIITDDGHTHHEYMVYDHIPKEVYESELYKIMNEEEE